ncbi:hypothetical protein [Nocardia sp. NPDC051570]|uniref:hypothetical protein n=1 Tax=Nocardia sp. NPDC051570 TaxID=3364324 RepID=UPI00379A288F
MSRHTRPTPTRSRWAAITLVIGVLAAIAVGPGISTASAGGFECKEVPAPEAPAMAEPATLDPDAIAEQDPNDHTGYGTYGWAGLSWYTYDLGCGEDITRSPKAVADTELGNTFFRTGQEMAAIAFWMDRQATTPDEAAKAGRVSFLSELDKLIITITQAVRDSTYGKYMAIALVIVGLTILWRGLRADIASVTKSALLGGSALLLGALFLGAPQQAIQLSDDTFAQLITNQQATIFADTGTTGKPRDVVLDQILLPDYTRGWFGDLDTANAHNLEPQIRDALALSYDEQETIRKDPSAADKIRDEKKQKWQSVVSGLEGNGLSYYTFQGKDSHRISIGLMSMVKVSTISLLWLGASLLKLAALLVIRLAILTAPIWIPIAAVHGGLMERVLRGLLAAYMWGVAASVLLAVYMLFVVRLYTTDVALSPVWKFWVTLLMTLFCWLVMRPFKRISAIARESNTSILNRSRLRRKALALAELGGAGLARIAAKKPTNADDNTSQSPRPEGTTVQQAELDVRRRKEQVAQQIAAQTIADHYRRRRAEHEEYWRNKAEQENGQPSDIDSETDSAQTPAAAAGEGIGGVGTGPTHPRTQRNEVVFVSIKGQSRLGRSRQQRHEPAGSNSMIWGGQLWVPPVSHDKKGGDSTPPAPAASAPSAGTSGGPLVTSGETSTGGSGGGA